MRLPALVAVLLALLPILSATKLVPQTREQVSFSYAPLVKRVAPAVVNVYAARAVAPARSPFAGDPFFERFFQGERRSRERNSRSLGSGVIVSDEGFLITNVHVVRGADELRVATRDGREFDAELVLADEASDIAVLRAEGLAESDHLQLGDSDELEVGDLVLAIGNPFGVGQTVTSGIVSGLARSKVGAGEFGFFIQTDASINPGNSGGALIGMNGRLIGINTAIFTRSGGSNGIGFAVPSNMVRVVLNSARNGSRRVERPWIGATFEAVNFELAQALGLDRPVGALIVEVDADGPAASAGLRSGDVILSLDGRRIEHLDALGYRIVTAGIGRPINALVLSRNREREVSVTLAPPKREGAPVEFGAGSPLAGATVMALGPANARKLRVRGQGVLVSKVRSGSSAVRAGFRPGDVLIAVNDAVVTTPDELAEAVERARHGWRFDFVRNRRRLRSIVR